MPPKTSSALSSVTPFFSPLGILNSPQNLSKLRGSVQLRTAKEYGEYVKFKFEVIAYFYKKMARKVIIARPIDVMVLP
jgi:hypothetical protein